MTPDVLIKKIFKSRRIGEVFGTKDWKRAYRAAVFQLHPDRTDHPGGATALIRLNELRAAHERGKHLADDAGELKAFDWGVRFEGGRSLLETSLDNFNKLAVLRNRAAQHFQQYLPQKMYLDRYLTAEWKPFAVSLSGQQLPLHHVNWLLSRLLEFCAWLSQEGYVHCGLHPESVWLIPKTHGIIVGSFYHLKRRGTRLSTISANYQYWYPTKILEDKLAITQTDLEMSKRLAAYLLGDRSGSGVTLRKTQPPPIVDFLLATHTDAYQCYDEFRQILQSEFDNKFYKLEIM
ncbi:MAG: hypothetical protein AAGJ93_10210 [Bacteroidota bacterium]